MPQDQEIDLFGYYSLADEVPKAFANIDMLHLSTVDERKGKMVKVPLYGFIRLRQRARVDYYLVKPILEGNQFTFSTKAIKGVSYQFNGTFLKLGNFPETRPEGEIVLKGRLIKMRYGKKVAESDVSFDYSAGG